MRAVRLCVGLAAITLLSASAFAKNNTLAEHAKNLCDEAGVPLEDCKALHPSLRPQKVAVAQPALKPTGPLGLGRVVYGTGKYGWCDDCSSLLAAAPITPWENFAGRQRQSVRDEDDRSFADAGSGSAPGGPDSDSGVGDASNSADNGDSGGGNSDNGGGGDTGGNGEICD